MEQSTFFKKLINPYLWGNIAAMVVTIVLLAVGIRYGIDIYTHHGEKIKVPRIINKQQAKAEAMLKTAGLRVQVSDTGYVKHLPPGCVLEQTPEAGQIVKSGRIVYIVINSPHTPTMTIPDIIDNCSLREAMARLQSMGFKLGQPEFMAGEKDWVYGLKADGRQVATGQKVSVEAVIVIQVGNGMRDLTDSVDYVDPVYEDDMTGEDGEVDEFEVVESEPEGEHAAGTQQQPDPKQQAEQPAKQQPAKEKEALP